MKYFKRNHKLWQLIFVILFITLFYSNISLAVSTTFKLTLVYYKEWTPGNAFGYPGFVGAGNFTSEINDEILLISAIPDKSDVITLCYFNGDKLEVKGSKDRDFSAVYNQILTDFDGDDDIELFISEDWRDLTNQHIGSRHDLYDFTAYSFYKNASINYYNPSIIIDYACVSNLNEEKGMELILATWDQNNKTELVRIYTYSNNNFTLIDEATLELSDAIEFRSVIFAGVGNFDTDQLDEILVVSKGTLISNPSEFFIDYNIYEYSHTTNEIAISNTGILEIENSNINFDIGDINSDTRDELIIYYDRVAAPTLQIYSLDSILPQVLYSNTRTHANYLVDGWTCNGIYIQDLTDDFLPEILISESTIKNNDFRGRYEIYNIVENNLVSKLLLEIEQPPTSV
ncbi:MAG: hypothetical protein ACFFDW_13235, partial [Candidatus Thorarchaeota archaeon]